MIAGAPPTGGHCAFSVGSECRRYILVEDGHGARLTAVDRGTGHDILERWDEAVGSANMGSRRDWSDCAKNGGTHSFQRILRNFL